MSTVIRPSRGFACLTIGILVLFLTPSVVAAHAELATAAPANGSTVPSPFDGPIVLTFSAALGTGSKADLVGSGGSVIASATVDGPGASMTIALDAALDAGDYEVKWVSVGDDGDLERGTVAFTVGPLPSKILPSPSDATSPTAPSTAPDATVAGSATPEPSTTPTADSAETADTADVLLPIVGLLVVAVVGAYLLTRRRTGAAR